MKRRLPRFSVLFSVGERFPGADVRIHTSVILEEINISGQSGRVETGHLIAAIADASRGELLGATARRELREE